MPYFSIDGVSIYNHLHEPKFHIFVFRDGKIKPAEFENKYTDVLNFHDISLYPHIAEIFGAKESFAVLFRPENYISLISRADTLGDLDRYFTDVIRLPIS